MDFEYLRKVSCSNLATFSSLAWSQSSFKRTELMQQDSAIPLLWFGSWRQKVHAYQILIRETASSHWEKTIFVQDTKAEILILKTIIFRCTNSW
jgi:hypothetical protein